MLLDRSTRSIEIILGEAHTTNPMDICAHWEDTFKEQVDRPNEQITRSNGVAAVIIVPAPADNVARRIREITICNNDTVLHTVTVRFNDATLGLFRAWTQTLAAGQTYNYTKESGWFPISGSLPYGPTTGSGAVVLQTSPALLGSPTAPTQARSDSSTKIATTAFAQPRAPATFTVVDASGAGLTFTSINTESWQDGNDIVNCGSFVFPANASGLTAIIGGFPVTVPNIGSALVPGVVRTNAAFPTLISTIVNTTTCFLYNQTTGALITNVQLTGATIWFYLAYPAS